MIRLSIARARILLHPRVTDDDALHAVNLIDRMLRTVATDQSTKKVDVGVLYNKPISEKGLREAALEVFKRLSGESKQPVEDKAFYEEMEKDRKVQPRAGGKSVPGHVEVRRHLRSQGPSLQESIDESSNR